MVRIGANFANADRDRMRNLYNLSVHSILIYLMRHLAPDKLH